MTMEVIKVAMEKGLDLVTIPSHTSHALEPLDVACFKPFKLAFRAYRDKWTVSHKGKVLQKEDLTCWVSWALKRVLSSKYITKGFACTGIHPLNCEVVNSKVGPSKPYDNIQGGAKKGSVRVPEEYKN